MVFTRCRLRHELHAPFAADLFGRFDVPKMVESECAVRSRSLTSAMRAMPVRVNATSPGSCFLTAPPPEGRTCLKISQKSSINLEDDSVVNRFGHWTLVLSHNYLLALQSKERIVSSQAHWLFGQALTFSLAWFGRTRAR